MIIQAVQICVLFFGSLLNQHTFLLGLLLLLSLQAGQADAADAVGASLEPGAAGHESAGPGALPAGLRCRNLQVHIYRIYRQFMDRLTLGPLCMQYVECVHEQHH